MHFFAKSGYKYNVRIFYEEYLCRGMHMSMFEIALCDTDVDYSLKAKNTIENYLKDISEKFRVIVYNKPKELLSDLKSQKIAPIMLYIGVELDNNSGINVVKEVNKVSRECRVIYLSRYLKYATEVYNTNHFYYVKKGELKDRLPNIFDKYRGEISENDKYIGMPLKNNKYAFININDVLYFERQGRYTNIYTNNVIYKTKYTLNQIEEKLGEEGFVRCHNSYIVSLDHVKEYQRDRVAVGDEKIPISRHYQVSTREIFNNYLKSKSKVVK